MWQDIVLTIVNITLAYALIPQVYKGFKDKKGHITFQTGLITTIGMYAIALTYFTLALFFSTIIATIVGTLWLILSIQTIIYKKN